jgi:hypothetical protein
MQAGNAIIKKQWIPGLLTKQDKTLNSTCNYLEKIFIILSILLKNPVLLHSLPEGTPSPNSLDFFISLLRT